MLLHLPVDFRHTAPRFAIFCGKDHITILSASAELAYSLSSSLSFILTFLFILSSPQLLQINCYPSECSALIQFPIFSYLWYPSLSTKRVPFQCYLFLSLYPKPTDRLYSFLQASCKS